MKTYRHRHLSARRAGGLSLVELLVATAITLIGLLVITQVFAVYEGWKRTTTGVAQTQEAGLMGAFAIEQDLRNAGFGMAGLSCAKIAAYNARATPSTSIEFHGSPVKICPDKANPAGCPADESRYLLSVIYSSSPFANIRVKLQQEMASSAAPTYVDNGLGFAAGDMLLLARDSDACAILQVSAPPSVEGENVTSPGSSWKLAHAPGDLAPWNPPDSTDILPTALSPNTRVLNLGQMIEHRFYVEDEVLRMDERSAVDGSVTTYDLAHGVVGLRAQCLPAGCGAQTTAVRFGLIVRSGLREKEMVSQAEVTTDGASASIAFWPGNGAPTLALKEEDRHYRYRVFHTVVPLKNSIWNPTP